MRDGKFPRSRDLNGKSVWFEDEVDDWINKRPVRPLKGDAAPPTDSPRHRRAKKVA